MEHRQSRRAFTIVELLVVVAIIALLVGILLPAIGKARERAKLQLSQANLRNLGVAHATYASAFNGRQVTFVKDSISKYGNSACNAFSNYAAEQGGHPNFVLGWGVNGGQKYLWYYHLDGGNAGHHCWAGNPIHWDASPGSAVYAFGQFRLGHQTKPLNSFLNGRYYDRVYFAPKDIYLWEIVKEGFDQPHEFASISADDGTTGNVLYTSSYCMSPAAMYSPDALRGPERGGFQDPWEMNGGLRSPAMDQALYPDLKTHMLEHHWLQNPGTDCNPGFSSPGVYHGCEQYYFNHGVESVPMTLFFDGHVRGVGVLEAMQADERHIQQTGSGLWSRDTPLSDDGYFNEYAWDHAETSFHIITTNGIRGRDTLVMGQ